MFPCTNMVCIGKTFWRQTLAMIFLPTISLKIQSYDKILRIRYWSPRNCRWWFGCSEGSFCVAHWFHKVNIQSALHQWTKSLLWMILYRIEDEIDYSDQDLHTEVETTLEHLLWFWQNLLKGSLWDTPLIFNSDQTGIIINQIELSFSQLMFRTSTAVGRSAPLTFIILRTKSIKFWFFTFLNSNFPLFTNLYNSL